MPGGPKRLEEREYEPLSRGVPALILTEEELGWDEALRVWRRARLFQRRAKAVTEARGISFARWELLEVTERLIREKDDAVSQQEVARRAACPKASVSELMRGSMDQGLVDIGPDAWGVSHRILMTRKGEEFVRSLRGVLVNVARLLGHGLR